jgi:hypothetical protein
MATLKVMGFAGLVLLAGCAKSATQLNAEHDTQCQSEYGLQKGTEAYGRCRVALAQAQAASDDRKAAAIAAMGQGLSRAGQTYSHAATQPVYTPPPRINCSSRTVGPQTYTNCY